jgi:hypothetical protein
MAKKITETYVKDEDKKHSVRYRSQSNTCLLKDMSLYVPRSILGDNPPNKITVTLEIGE